jgi:hypothetical protein
MEGKYSDDQIGRARVKDTPELKPITKNSKRSVPVRSGPLPMT